MHARDTHCYCMIALSDRHAITGDKAEEAWLWPNPIMASFDWHQLYN